MASYILRLDDIAPNMDWERYLAVVELLDQFDVKPIAGVIPDNRDPKLLEYPECPFDFWEHVRERQERGWTVALHGYQHLYVTDDSGILGMNPRSEFAGLPYEEQHEKIRRGLQIFREHGIDARSFMAPAHSFDGATLSALRSLDFEAITDGFGLYPYIRNGLLHVPQQVATARPMPLGVFTFCLHPNWMSDSAVERLRAFLMAHREHVIPFPRARDLVAPAWTQRPVEIALKVVLGTGRKVRSWRS